MKKKKIIAGIHGALSHTRPSCIINIIITIKLNFFKTYIRKILIQDITSIES